MKQDESMCDLLYCCYGKQPMGHNNRVSQNETPNLGSKTVGQDESMEEIRPMELFDIIDGWYHDMTRHHIVDVDPKVLDNLLKPLADKIRAREQQAYERGERAGRIDELERLETHRNEYETEEEVRKRLQSLLDNSFSYQVNKISKKISEERSKGNE